MPIAWLSEIPKALVFLLCTRALRYCRDSIVSDHFCSEVHLSDLIKAHEGNPDFNKHDPTKIHWAKFSMMGKFILSTTHFQAQCRTSNDYNFTAREHINDLLMRDCVMDAEVSIFLRKTYSYRCNLVFQMQKSRITPPPDLDEIDDSMRLYLPRTPSRDNGVPTKDTALIRKLMFWGS